MQPPVPSSENRKLAFVVIVLVALMFIFHVTTALLGHGRYRDQHLGTALHYAATHIDLKDTIIVGFNATDTPTIQELPVWQMAVGLVFKCLGSWWGWANIVSLILFLNCLYPLYQITKRFYGSRTAWWALIFFLSEGLIFVYSGEAGTDGFCLCVSIWFLYACCQLIYNPIKWFLPAAALGALAAVSKMPFFMAAGLASFFLLIKERGFKWKELAALAGVGAISGVLFFAWTHYTDSLQKNALFPFVDLRFYIDGPKSASPFFWYFGDLHYRLNPINWGKAAWRFADAGFGSFTLMILFVAGLANRRVHPAAKLILAGPLLTTLIFTHLILHHYNYLMMYSMPVAILCAVALTNLELFITSHGADQRLVTTISLATIFLGLFQGVMGMKAFSFDSYPAKMARAIDDHTTAQDKLVIVNGGWGGDELIRAKRIGLSAWGTSGFDENKQYAQLKKLGFNKIVILSQSPFENAIQIVNPGETGIPRDMAASYETPLLKQWPTVYRTDDIIIKDIP